MLTVDTIQRTFRAMLNSYNSFGSEAKDAQRDIGLKIAIAMSTPGKDTDSMFKDVRGDYLRDAHVYLASTPDDVRDRIADFAQAVQDAKYFGKGVDEAAQEFLRVVPKPMTTSIPVITADVVADTTDTPDPAIGGNTTVMPQVPVVADEAEEAIPDVHPALRPVLDGMGAEYNHVPKHRENFEYSVAGAVRHDPETAYKQIRAQFLLDMDTARRMSPFVDVIRKNHTLGLAAA